MKLGTYNITNIVAITQYIDRNSFLSTCCDLEDYETAIKKIMILRNSEKYKEIGYINEFLDISEVQEEIKNIKKTLDKKNINMIY